MSQQSSLHRSVLPARPSQALGLARCLVAAAGIVLGSAQAAVFEWSAGSGVMPDRSGAFSLITQGDVRAGLLPGGPLQLVSEGAGSNLLLYRASGKQIQMHDGQVLDMCAPT